MMILAGITACTDTNVAIIIRSPIRRPKLSFSATSSYLFSFKLPQFFLIFFLLKKRIINWVEKNGRQAGKFSQSGEGDSEAFFHPPLLLLSLSPIFLRSQVSPHLNSYPPSKFYT